ncbi:hypothetical protein GGR56DRAFT_435334 [Xylariaceae sp. FL0804]|nr:hypothetical protein GGR56DRAFT_435334 [Xylariaceae sp. FL0804]
MATHPNWVWWGCFRIHPTSAQQPPCTVSATQKDDLFDTNGWRTLRAYRGPTRRHSSGVFPTCWPLFSSAAWQCSLLRPLTTARQHDAALLAKWRGLPAPALSAPSEQPSTIWQSHRGDNCEETSAGTPMMDRLLLQCGVKGSLAS